MRPDAAVETLAPLERVVRSVRYRVSARHLFLDPLHDSSRAVIVLGSARSGTTWLAQLLSVSRRTRFVLEPLHARSPLRPSTFVWGDWRPLDSNDPALREAWARVLSGRARSAPTDRMNECRLATRRVVKCVAGTNLAGWLRSSFPTVPIIYLVRHPFAVSSSAADLASSMGGIWGSLTRAVIDDLISRSAIFDGPLASFRSAATDIYRNGASTFGMSVLRWCLENVVALRSPPASGFLCVRYEELLADPESQFTALASLARLDARIALSRFERPSRFAVRSDVRSRTRADRISDWERRLAPAELREGSEILDAFGIGPDVATAPTEAAG